MNDGGFQAEPSGHGLDIGMYGMGIDAADINNDLIPDLLITNINTPVLLTSQDDFWVNSTLSLGFDFIKEREVCWGVDWYDINNDGHEDVWIGCGPLLFAGQDPEFPPILEQPDALYLWTPDGFQEVATDWGIDTTTSTRGWIGDFNNDDVIPFVSVTDQ